MKTRTNSIVRTCGILTASAITAAASPALASVVNYGGLVAGVRFSPPSNLDLRLNKTENDNLHDAFQETYNRVVPPNVKYDAYLPGLYDQPGDLEKNSYIPGVGVDLYNSIIIHFDPHVGGNQQATGFIEFNNPFYVITHPNGDLDSSDPQLGISSWSYPTKAGDRGYDLADKDSFTLSNPSSGIWRIDFDARATKLGLDEIRMVEIVGSTPAPGSLALLGLGGLLAARRRRA